LLWQLSAHLASEVQRAIVRHQVHQQATPDE